MAYFANIDNSGQVLAVISIHNSVLGEPYTYYPETEQVGLDFISNVLLLEGTWKQTSYNKNFRKNYAGIGHTYDQQRDAFIPPKPFSSWILNEKTCQWEPPVPKPDGNWWWDETETSWREMTNDII